MKNLKLTTELSLQLDLLSQGERLLLSSYDIERNRIFFASSSNLIYTIPLLSSQVSNSLSFPPLSLSLLTLVFMCVRAQLTLASFTFHITVFIYRDTDIFSWLIGCSTVFFHLSNCKLQIGTCSVSIVRFQKYLRKTNQYELDPKL